MGRRGNTRGVVASFVVSAVASLGLTVVYALGGQPQLEGALLGLALGGLAVGCILLAKNLLPPGNFVQHRDVEPDPSARPDVEEDFLEGTEIPRRSFIGKALGAAVGALGIAALFPIRSLGHSPGSSLFKTSWEPGRLIVTPAGVPLRPEDIAVNGVLTVFPQGATDAADSQTLLLHLPGDLTAPGPEGTTHEGICAFSKICTHAGCPVGLYQAQTQELFCPCHQSVFSVLDGAAPTGGPATRPLPQLPIGVNEEGYLVALDDFPEAVGPGFWNRPE